MLAEIQFLVAILNAAYFTFLYKKARLVPLPLLLFCISDAVTAPFNLLYVLLETEGAYKLAITACWLFTVAEVVFVPMYLSALVHKKYDPYPPAIIAILLPILQIILYNAQYHYVALNFLLSGILIAYHCYRFIFNSIASSSENPIEFKTNATIVFGIMICYIPSIPLSIGLITNHFFASFYKIRIDSGWTENAFLIGNILQHIFFFIPFRWSKLQQTL